MLCHHIRLRYVRRSQLPPDGLVLSITSMVQLLDIRQHNLVPDSPRLSMAVLSVSHPCSSKLLIAPACSFNPVATTCSSHSRCWSEHQQQQHKLGIHRRKVSFSSSTSPTRRGTKPARLQLLRRQRNGSMQKQTSVRTGATSRYSACACTHQVCIRSTLFQCMYDLSVCPGLRQSLGRVGYWIVAVTKSQHACMPCPKSINAFYG